jgi:hypothetical protein
MDDITHSIETNLKEAMENQVYQVPEKYRPLHALGLNDPIQGYAGRAPYVQHRLEATLQVTSKDGSKRPHQIFSGFSADLASNTIRNFVDETLHSGDLKSGDKVKIEVVVL